MDNTNYPGTPPTKIRAKHGRTPETTVFVPPKKKAAKMLQYNEGTPVCITAHPAAKPDGSTPKIPHVSTAISGVDCSASESSPKKASVEAPDHLAHHLETNFDLDILLETPTKEHRHLGVTLDDSLSLDANIPGFTPIKIGGPNNDSQVIDDLFGSHPPLKAEAVPDIHEDQLGADLIFAGMRSTLFGSTDIEPESQPKRKPGCEFSQLLDQFRGFHEKGSSFSPSQTTRVDTMPATQHHL